MIRWIARKFPKSRKRGRMEKAYYVDQIRAQKISLLAGPFRSAEIARRYQPAALAAAEGIDPWVAFDEYGVVALDAPDYRPLGKINHLLDIDQADLMEPIQIVKAGDVEEARENFRQERKEGWQA